MAINTCRVCGRALWAEPLLRYANMPKAAQHFPDAAALAGETGVDLTVCQCSGCGLAQLSNAPVPYFQEVIRAAAFSAVLRDLKTRQFAGFLEKYALQGKKIIEIGCGRGEFLALLPPDVQAYGLEYSAASVAACVQNGLRVSRGYLDGGAAVLADAPFDAFLLLMFLEHMPDPNAALQGICNNLNDGGVGLIEVPNFDMLLRDKLFSEFIGDHLLYFSRETLRTALQLNGFDVLECHELRDGYVIAAEVRKRARLDVSSFQACQAKIQAAIDEYIGRFPANKVAVWGAGHQALAMIALTKIAGRIRYVIDSAPFKQGKFTPATHVPVVAPNTLRSDPVDAVIVMAAAYSDEVAGILRQHYGPHIHIAILRDFGLEAVG